MDPRCEICGARHHPRQAHRFTESLGGVSDAPDKGREELLGTGTGRVGSEEPDMAFAGTRVGVAGRTANRRTREAYNAYMREYMRKRRGPKVSA